MRKLSGKKKWKLLLFNLGIVIIDTLLFSKAFLGLELLSGSALSLSFAWTAIVTSVLAFVVGNKALMKTEETRFLMQGMHSLDDCVPVFKEAIHQGDVFDEAIEKNLEQIKRFKRKYDTIHDLLLQKFSAEEISFQKFSGILQEVENVVYLNMRSILNKIAAFDVDEYESMQRRGFGDDDLTREKLGIYHEYINFVNSATKTNENILLKLDKMLLEISRYNSLEDGDVQKLPAMVEMDELIKSANLYK